MDPQAGSTRPGLSRNPPSTHAAWHPPPRPQQTHPSLDHQGRTTQSTVNHPRYRQPSPCSTRSLGRQTVVFLNLNPECHLPTRTPSQCSIRSTTLRTRPDHIHSRTCHLSRPKPSRLGRRHRPRQADHTRLILIGLSRTHNRTRQRSALHRPTPQQTDNSARRNRGQDPPARRRPSSARLLHHRRPHRPILDLSSRLPPRSPNPSHIDQRRHMTQSRLSQPEWPTRRMRSRCSL